jgi:hypothetical protein
VSVVDERLHDVEDNARGWTLRYGIRLRDLRGRASPFAPAADLVLDDPAPAPVDFHAEPSSDGIRLSWRLPEGWSPPPPEETESGPDSGAEPPEEEPGDEPVEGAETAGEEPAGDEPAGEEAVPATPTVTFNVYRTEPGAGFPESPVNVAPIPTMDYLDPDVTLDTTYLYAVRVVMDQQPSLREGRTAGPVEVQAIDRFPPATPQSLIRVQEGPAVRLFWRPNDERDLAGYRVYRRVDGGPWQQVGENSIERPSFVDSDVRVGQRLSYRVTAIDRVDPPNESEPTEPVEIEIVAEPNAPGG